MEIDKAKNIVSKRGRKSLSDILKDWEEEKARAELLRLCYAELYKAMRSRNISQKKKIEIALALVKRRIPQDQNITADVKVNALQIEFVK